MTTWALAHPWLTFIIALISGPFWMVSVIAIGHAIFKVINRLLRTLKVLARGWPPPHLDADGDFNLTLLRRPKEG